MTNEEFQKLLLEKFETLGTEIKGIKADIAKLPTREELYQAIARKTRKPKHFRHPGFYSLFLMSKKKINAIYWDSSGPMGGNGPGFSPLRDLLTPI